MAFTPKQARNGVDMGVTTGPTPASDDMSGQIRALSDKAVSVGGYRFGQQAVEGAFVTPFGTGVAGGNYFDPGSNMWDWDDGLAIAEQPGED